MTVADGWLIARYPRVHCTYFGPSVSAAAFDKHIDQLARDIDARSDRERIGVLYYVPESATINSARRRRIAKVLVDRKAKLERTTAAYAMATHSPFVRGVLTTLFWMAPPGYPHAMVATPEEGLGFIAERVPEHLGP